MSLTRPACEWLPVAPVKAYKVVSLPLGASEKTVPLSPVPPELAEPIAGYVELAKTFEPADARYLTNHRGHLMAVKDIERQFVTAEMIRRTTFTGTADDLRERISALRDGGYTQFTIQLVPGQEKAIEDWGRIAKAFM